MESTVTQFTAKTAKALEVLKDNGGVMIGADVAAVDAELFPAGAASVSSILSRLHKLGFINKLDEKVDRIVVDAKSGNEVTRQYTAYEINEAGKELVYEIKA